ncbi:hypothetical protein CCR75_005907 [Bremia lactucae]|uniref:Uncharacterized protein n=1 Tax=Bremia lactucae TaxID=4779 RepID=A0A976FEA9_BRELC|nr:hypothetical protein CCR75_005907 [Bremia lactucae]
MRAHRRKLHFSCTKDVASVVSAKNKNAHQRPLKRRKRQARSRCVSPIPKRQDNSLPAALWSDIQEKFAVAKSLGTMYRGKTLLTRSGHLVRTRIVLHFFTEHENLQGSSFGPAFPILIPSSEIYRMKGMHMSSCFCKVALSSSCVLCSAEKETHIRRASRLGRTYVTTGIGVIKRVRYDEKRKVSGGYFLYYGKASVVQHLVQLKSKSAQIMTEFRQSRQSQNHSIVEEDSALVKVFEDQAAADKWPCLVSMTVCFLGLLFQQNYQSGVGLPAISARLVEAKTFIGSLILSSSTEAPCRDVHRRVYDVVSVLASCNMIDTSPVPSSDSIDKNLRKYVRFNYDIFTNPRALFASIDADKQWNVDAGNDPMFSDMMVGLPDFKCPRLEVSFVDHLASPSLQDWQSMHDELPLASPTAISPITVCASRVTWAAISYKKNNFASTQSHSVSKLRVGICVPAEQLPRPTHQFFSPLGTVPIKKNDWYDESLKHIELSSAIECKIDWELNTQLKENNLETWGCFCSEPASTCTPVRNYHQNQEDKLKIKLKCREEFDNDTSSNIDNYFC